MAPVIKRNPERYFEQSHDQLLKTTASVLKSKKRAPIVFKETHRTHSKAYSGIAAPNNQESATSRAEVQQSIRQNYVGSGPRNLERQGAWDDVSFGDYGKDKVVLSMNSRDITGTRTHVTNFRSEVPNQQASVQDQAKTTKKENFIGNNTLKKNYDFLIVDFHGEITSEKMAIGHLFDGKATLVIGTHTHVPTNDARIFKNGTAYQTDAGMCGDYNSVIGMNTENSLNRFFKKSSLRHFPSTGEASLCGVIVEGDIKTGLAKGIKKFIYGGNLNNSS